MTQNNNGLLGLPAGFDYVRVLGRGSTGWVVLARQEALDRLVAVKTIHTTGAHAGLRRLQREARVLAGLNHPGIVPVYQLRAAASSVSLVMKYFPGGDLASRLRTGRLAGARVVAVLSNVADALTAAGGAGVVHRDVKPANVLIDTNGLAVLADFGLARLPRGAAGFRTVSGTVTGTPLYMAPEQITDPQSESPAIDAYAFGVLAYQLLTGRWPYADATWTTVLDAHLSAEPVPPQQVRPSLPAAVCLMLMQALAKDPRTRAMPAALAAALAGIPADRWDAILPPPAGPSIGAGAVARPGGVTAGLGQTGAEVSTEGVETGMAENNPDSEPQAHPDLHPDPHPRAATAEIDDQVSARSALDMPAEWVQPPVFTLRRRRGRLAGLLIGSMIGLVVGLVFYLEWMRP